MRVSLGGGRSDVVIFPAVAAEGRVMSATVAGAGADRTDGPSRIAGPSSPTRVLAGFRLPRIRGRRGTDNSWLLPPAGSDHLGSKVSAAGNRRSKIIDGGSYSGCHVTRSNSLPSGSAKVVWRTAATPGGSASGGRLTWWSGRAPRAVSRSVSLSWWSVTRMGWTLFLAVPGR